MRSLKSSIGNLQSSMLSLLLAVGMLGAGAARGAEYCVATNGNDGNTGIGWANALLTISNAVAKATTAGDIVTVSNGAYGVTAEILITNAITVCSFMDGLSGASNTVVYRSSGTCRVFNISNATAVVSGFSITNGSSGAGNGGGVAMIGGTLRSCIVRNNTSGSGSSGDGGGIYISGANAATVTNCIVINNSNNSSHNTANGGGAFVENTANPVLFVSCVFSNNTVSKAGGGIVGGGGTVIRNCLILNNTAGEGNNISGSAVYGLNAATRIENSTIVGNTCAIRNNSGIYNCIVTNSIVYGNVASGALLGGFSSPEDRFNYYSCTFSYSCTKPLPAGVGNTDVAPRFVNAAGGDYRLLPGPQLDAGVNLTAWMSGATDLAGNPRITNSVTTSQTVDMGAYEYMPGALDCYLVADKTAVLAPAQVVFTNYVAGTNQNSLYYRWDFGDTKTAAGSDRAVVTNTYDNPGLYTVQLTVSNAVGEVAASTRTGYVTAWATSAYVWTNSPGPLAPYTNWATAAKTISVAGDAPSGVTLWATNGTYSVGTQVVIAAGVTVRSVAGKAVTTIQPTVANAHRVIYVNHADAVLDGFTVRNGGSYSGAGVLLYTGRVINCTISNCYVNVGGTFGVGMYVASGGLVSNCLVYCNLGNDTSHGGGIWLSSGMVLNSTISGNQLIQGNNYGAGIYSDSSASRVENCVITSNKTSTSNNDVNGGGFRGHGTLRNCLIAYNQAGGGNNGKGGGVYLEGGLIENCTIVSNYAAGTTSGDGGGVYRAGGAVSNSIVFFNRTAWGSNTNIYTADATAVGYTCTTNPVIVNTGNISGDPLFVDPASGDFRLQGTSPCIDAGTNRLAWMNGALDLGGQSRILKGNKGLIVDMGAYETYVPPKGTVFMMR